MQFPLFKRKYVLFNISLQGHIKNYVTLLPIGKIHLRYILINDRLKRVFKKETEFW